MLDQGEHYIDVTYFNKPVAGSPFTCQVFDWSRIGVRNLPSSGMVDRTINFDSEYWLFHVNATFALFVVLHTSLSNSLTLVKVYFHLVWLFFLRFLLS